MPSSDLKHLKPQSGVFAADEHHEWALKMWKRMDRDGSGYITRAELDCEEFRSVIRHVLAPTKGAAMGGVEYARAEMNMTQAINYCLRKADINGDNSLSFEEFKSFLRTLRHQDFGKSTAYLIFSLFDLDNDTFIDESEFREIFRFFLGHKPTETDFQLEWGLLDRHGKGKVRVEDYIDWLKTSPNPIFHQHAPKDETAQDPLAQTSTTSFDHFDGKYLPRMTKSHSSSSSSAGFKQRARWNQRFNAGANKNDCCPQGQRDYFMKFQSLPELKRYYDTHRGFREMSVVMSQPEEKIKTPVLSSERKGELSLPRSVPGSRHGFMKNSETGKPEYWDEFWPTPKCVKSFYQPGTLSFRCPGTPPKWMTSDPYDDE
mmetsp:Transcript_87206/g.154459  ORF Transcript_87206/g.154459 Transcript_87206/m.154459 type:complete len:373 (+) Transcript_87206:71-1189(+)|eukprot:CAMPEP_0197652252 /NCGR_PEP_ID=MMETSP1338-20131121/34336_1 /TAXON_ID=43686 ORGANISM="Pelagodinium beii, Strain RCC1491" /NCGR_SAMPLE_ID=MMETSP1338 /ASSEMBLY_ACC=CAM_ASM_000754 /LENGTH=372 /DNA_ID=CAMNT_0043227085 /DNA_START=64 /DNA_END=1182 /DNA_ORIENTATION=-